MLDDVARDLSVSVSSTVEDKERQKIDNHFISSAMMTKL